MTRRIFVVACALLLVPSGSLGTTGALAKTDGSPPQHASVPAYLALGDSLATGVGASNPDETGYVPLFHNYLRHNLECGARGSSEVCPSLRLENIAVSGATTTTLVQNQLPLALDELEARNQDDNPRNDVEVITIDIAGNDAFALLGVCSGGVTPQCAGAIQTTFATIAQNLTLTLSQLRAAAGEDTEIVVMTYYNPLVGCRLSAFVPLGDLVLEGGPGLPVGMNDIIRSVAAGVDASVAETFGLLGPDDLVGGADCLHADDSGYQIIADAFADALAD
ncbi:MAG: SGNH/GDSL hydrolase family protein [Actinomycetota bacterium]